jgi:hypothetical protein
MNFDEMNDVASMESLQLHRSVFEKLEKNTVRKYNTNIECNLMSQNQDSKDRYNLIVSLF